MSDKSDLLTIAETAKLIRVTPLTLKNWRDRGEGPPWARLGPGTIRYRRSSLLVFLDHMERRSQPETEARRHNNPK